MGRKSRKVILSESDRIELQSRANAISIDYRYVVRAKIILLFEDGLAIKEIAQKLNIGTTAVSKWKTRFIKHGVPGLTDMPRSGAPAIYTEADKARVIQKACSKPKDGYSNWSQRRIAKECNMSQSTVHEILKNHELKPHKVEYWCGKSTDPEFEAKMLQIVGLYMNPPENALVLSVDEKTQMQALDRSQPELPMRPGNPRRQTATYKRHGTVSLIAALSVHEGEITAKTIEKNNAATFLKFLKKLDRKYRNKKLYIIVDNLSVHKQKDVMEWVNRKRKINLVFTPTYSSWLNQIEIWFNILTKDVLKNAVWHSRDQLVKQLVLYVKTYNKTKAKPFKWTYDGK